MANPILRRPNVECATGLSRSSIYAKLDPSSPYYDASFPKPIKLGKRAVGWREADISAWLESRTTGAA
ncbi:AlpA family phage regulatory protein [Roseovarius sp. EGI FJ00037]|uniref:AlpA family phage regulatory protein n=1 Tax=Roseovarius salincola TaxID=2978479 RepID=UPI0022A8BB67|nr:AlpA family phage regulatory protein [Roseovarius sp. EGI FJ00037]MCZ0814001.1 AlpA family phage regulatory protein [Roseovarius sp. EGI FJ00037]